MEFFSILFTIISTMFTIFSIWLSIATNKKTKKIRLVKKDAIEETKKAYENKYLSTFTSRNDMMAHLKDMIKDASKGDEIWGQSVSGNAYCDDLHNIIGRATDDDVKFKMIFNSNIDIQRNEKSGLINILKNNKSAKVKTRDDCKIRIQGLSNKEVVIAFNCGIQGENYLATKITDPDIVKVWHDWFDDRWTGATPYTTTKK